nr:zinc finger BED domain-containing protein RICESLEEPER 2 [Tanacetum cinerariifolium]
RKCSYRHENSGGLGGKNRKINPNKGVFGEGRDLEDLDQLTELCEVEGLENVEIKLLGRLKEMECKLSGKGKPNMGKYHRDEQKNQRTGSKQKMESEQIRTEPKPEPSVLVPVPVPPDDVEEFIKDDEIVKDMEEQLEKLTGRDKAKQRTRLSTTIVEALICTQDWVRTSRTQINWDDVEDFIKDDEVVKDMEEQLEKLTGRDKAIQR